MANVLQAEPDGQRLSDWIEQAPIGRTAAYALLQALAITPAKVRLQGVARPVAMLTAEQAAALDAGVDRLQQGESIAQLGSDAPPSGIVQDHSRMIAPSGLEALAVALQGLAPAAPLARARALRDAATEGLLLTTAELAMITGASVEELELRRSGQLLQGFRAWKVGKPPALVWRLEAIT